MKKKFFTIILIQIIGAFLIAIIVSTLFFTLVMNSIREGVTAGLIMGGAFGLIITLIGSINLKPQKVSISFKNRDDFLAKLNKSMGSINYKFRIIDNNVYVYQDARRFKIKLADVTVKFNSNLATIEGHSVHIKRIQSILK